MALADVARELQEAASADLLWLRDMRKYVNLNNDKALQAERRRLAEFDASLEALTMEGQRRRWRMFADLERKCRTRELYQEVLQEAGQEERKRKGGGEAFAKRARPAIMERLAEIDALFHEEKEYQLRIKEVAADGGCDRKSGNQAAAAADGGGGRGCGTAESQK